MILFSLLFLLQSCSAKENNEVFINGRPIVCDREAYNCPSYTGKNKWKRLKSCEEVRIVWDTCKKDIHDLDRDGDGRPCERDCKKQRKK